MKNDVKTILKISERLYDSLGRLRKQYFAQCLKEVQDILGVTRDLFSIAKDIGVSLNKNWLYAADKCTQKMDRSLDELNGTISNVKRLKNDIPETIPVVRDIFEELMQVRQEFGDMKVNLKTNTISVTTDSITLEDICFGPFEIKLEVNKIARLCSNESFYSVTALDPNPASSNEEVTHPHVSSDTLCEGDGHIAIRKAVEQGRFCDFFTLIHNILKTYNPDSPYVAIEDWSGVCCYDCGGTIDRDNTYYCYSCENDFCESCTSYCHYCDETLCYNCGSKCPSCGEFTCRNCITECAECGSTICKGCMEDGNICSKCQSLLEEIENREPVNKEKEPKNEKTDITIQPDGMGEAALLQG